MDSSIEKCFNSAQKIVFDNTWNQNKSLPILAVVFEKFTSIIRNTAKALKSKTEKNKFIILIKPNSENFLNFSLISEETDEVFEGSRLLYCPQQFKSFYEAQCFHNKIILTFYENSKGDRIGILQLKDFHFFLYLESRFVMPEKYLTAQRVSLYSSDSLSI